MIQEEVKLLDGTTKVFDIRPLSYRMRNEIMSQCSKTKYGSNGQDADVDLFKVQTLTLERCAGINLDLIDPNEGDRVFHEHYAQSFGMGNKTKNLESTSETQ